MNSLSTISHPNQHTTFSLSSVAYASFYWRNREDNIHCRTEPKYYSANGVIFNAKEFAPLVDGYEGETLLERARRLGILDSWTPVVKFTLKNGHRLIFEGERAKSLWKAWNAKVFSTKKKCSQQ